LADDLQNGENEAARIAATAISLISDRGIEAVSVESVAVLGGIDSKVVSAHYPGAPELVEAAILLDEARFNRDVAARWETEPTPGDQLVSLLRHLVLQYDWTVWIELWSLALREEWVRTLRHRIDQGYHDLFATVIERGRRAGDFRVDDVAQTAIAIATIIDALAVQATLGDPRVSPHFMLDTCVDCAARLLDAALVPPSLGAAIG
jgi:hypothetical protein